MEMDFFIERTRRMAARTLFGLALAYAFIAGLRTVADFDVGWLLALGRYLVTQHVVPRTDVLSYTASGVPWIYPPFGGALLYLVYTVGGFSALSWINAIGCAAVVAVTVGRSRLLTTSLAILAVPSIAFRTAPRAELFTTFFFAAYLALLCRHRRQESETEARLWLLPLMMLVWVNVHSGFSSGVVLLGAYVAWELLDCCFASRRLAAVMRLNRDGNQRLAEAIVAAWKKLGAKPSPKIAPLGYGEDQLRYFRHCWGEIYKTRVQVNTEVQNNCPRTPPRRQMELQEAAIRTAIAFALQAAPL